MASEHGWPRSLLGCRRAKRSQAATVKSRCEHRLLCYRSTTMELADRSGSVRAFQAMVAMRDGTRLNTFVFLPESGGPRWPVILHRTPYGIAAPDAADKTDCSRAWLPSAEEPFRGSILRGWRKLTRTASARV